jgi:hypothetical protein
MSDKQAATPYVSPNGYTSDFGPNVENILVRGMRVINGKIPTQVRKELAAAVKAGVLGRIKKDGLKPEIYFHPAHKHGAMDRQKREAEYAKGCIAKVMVSGSERAEHYFQGLAQSEQGEQP